MSVDNDIKAIMFPSIDRGVSCWSSFLTLIQDKFPKCEAVFISQNYSYHHNDGTCIDDVCVPKGIQLEYAFSNSKISQLFLLDRQSFDENYYNEKISNVTLIKRVTIGTRVLYIEHDCDDIYLIEHESPSDYELTLNHLFTTIS